jgi:hypothetical protein
MKKYSDLHLANFTREELDSFSLNQLEKVSVDSLKSLLRMRENEKKVDIRIVDFWKNEYPKMTNQEKAKYWAGSLFRSMRMQEESNQSPYIIYSEIWLRETLKLDPNFIELLPIIYNIWGGMFDSGKVDRIIQKHLKKMLG